MDGLVVETRAGKVRGTVERSLTGDSYYSFKGVPYAKPPVGQLRFEDPEPVEAWSGIRDATEFGPVCAQFKWFDKNMIGGDDCLYLNVYTKQIKPKPLLPVIVWIHGGSFFFGDGSDGLYGPDYFMRKDIVLVTINYRVGVLGFLNLEDEFAPGNQGLKDQTFALKWIRDNIEKFGGNSGNVTISGESAGGTSVHYHTLSSFSKGLFHKAICQSGVVLCPWASSIPNPKISVYKICELLGYKSRNHKEIVEFLRNVDCAKLNEAQMQLSPPLDEAIEIFPFAPGIDAKSKNPFMPVHPTIAAKQGVQVPLIIGFNSREGLLYYTKAKDCRDQFYNDIDSSLHPNVIKLLNSYNRSPQDLKRLYLGDSATEIHEKEEKIVDLLGDLTFVEAVQRVVKIQTEKGSAATYLYKYSYDKIPSAMKVFYQTSLKGSCHVEELRHLFKQKKMEEMSFLPFQKGTDAYRITEQVVEMWVNFAKTGRPTLTPTELIPFYWQPVANGTVLRYLNICEDMRMEVTLNLEQRYICH